MDTVPPKELFNESKATQTEFEDIDSMRATGLLSRKESGLPLESKTSIKQPALPILSVQPMSKRFVPVPIRKKNVTVPAPSALHSLSKSQELQPKLGQVVRIIHHPPQFVVPASLAASGISQAAPIAKTTSISTAATLLSESPRPDSMIGVRILPPQPQPVPNAFMPVKQEVKL